MTISRGKNSPLAEKFHVLASPISLLQEEPARRDGRVLCITANSAA